MASRSLQDWLQRIETLHPQGIELGLDRIRRVHENLGSPQPGRRRVVVAGTNGKGSTVTAVDALLRCRGLRVGTYTSPHLRHFRERAQVQGEPLSDADWCAAFERVEAARQQVSLTYFEFTTLAAFDLLARADLDVAVLEVGLGGRLDAVNLADADVAVVTRIALDHQDWLGEDLNGIAREKAGIFRPGTWAIGGQADAPPALAEAAQAAGTRWLQRGVDFEVSAQADAWSWQGRDGQGQALQLSDLPLPALPQDSVATALQVLACLGTLPPLESLHATVASLSMPGRFQRFLTPEGIPVVIDVAHNPDAAHWLLQRLQNAPVAGRTVAVFATLADKDVSGIAAILHPVVDAWLLTELPGVERACSMDKLIEAVRQAGSRTISSNRNVRQALARARQLAGPQDRILVCGSFHTAGAALDALKA